MKLRLVGQRNQLGGGTHFGEFANALKQLSHLGALVEELDAFDEGAMAAAAAASSDRDVTVWFWQSPAITRFKGRQIVWAIFESDRLPAHWIDYLRAYADVVWVPSHWGRDVLVANGLDAARIDVLPEGVNGDHFHPHLRQSLARHGQPFRFLSVGKFEKRKGYEALLAGFKAAFDGRPDVELLIKADYFIDLERKKAELIALVESLGIANVRLFWGAWSQEQLFALYNYADAFVFASRAEGWGLPLLEAAASGLPLISTYYSGHTEFLQHGQRSLIKIAHTLEPIDDPDFLRFWPGGDGNPGRWAKPAVESIRAGMVLMRENYASYQQEAMANALRLIARFSWRASAHAALVSLDRRSLLRIDYAIRSA